MKATYCSAREHHGLEQKQPDLAVAAVLAADGAHEGAAVEQRHVRVHEPEVCLKKRIL